MKIIHLLNNWKWTERSELVIDLAASQKRLGHEVRFVCGKPPAGNESVPDVSLCASQKGLTDVIALSEMARHLKLFSVFRGVKKLRGILSSFKPDVIHSHMRNDHFLAGLAAAKDRETLMVRSVYNPNHLAHDLRSRWCYRSFTNGLIVVGEKVRQSALSRSFSPEKVEVIPPAVDLDRFSPARELTESVDFSLPEDCFVAGVVSRIRQTRRLDIPLEAIYRLKDQYPRLRLLLVGHGRTGAYETVIEKPAADLGVRDHIIQAGYCRGDDLVAAYRQMHVLLYPMPGSDKTCRTVREALAAGVPVIAPNMEFLPELIEDGQNGFLVSQSPEGFAAALQKLMDFPDTLQTLSGQALSSARERFDLLGQANKVLNFYSNLASKKPSGE